MVMATVYLPSGLTAFTDGVDTVEIDASRVIDLITALAERFPALAPQLDEMAVAIDGEIYQEPGYQPLTARSEVHLVPRIAGG
jgi:molybdopterin converting factor small subunit